MWTPRRVGLLLLGVAGFVAAYLAYSYALGGFDGLPAIPPEYLKAAAGQTVPRYPVSTTIERLQQAFGPDSPEGGTSTDYMNRLQIPGRDGVLACGSPKPNGTPLVTVEAVSVALFGKPPLRPRPGEVPDITTFHADKAVLRFDRPVSKIDEMHTAKVVSIELVSDPDDNPNTAQERKDPRKGRIWISHNRKSPDPADHVVVRTVGPLFVQLPDENTPDDPNVPHVWTTAAVEVFDRQNLPRKLRERKAELSRLSAVTEVTRNVPPVAALARPADLRRYGAVADILCGDSLPPPTVVAVGMKVFLAPAKADPNAPKRSGRVASFSGAREIVLCEQVQMCLWTDGTSGFPGGETDARGQKAEAAPLGPNADPPLAIQSVVGGLLDGGTLANRLETRSLLLIDTPGAFRYDLEKGVATFDTAAQPPADRHNLVVVTRLSATNRTDDLVCSKLTLDLLDPNRGKDHAGGEPPADTGLSVRGVTADGPQVYVSVQAEGIEASGAKLKYVNDATAKRSVVTLWGTPAAPVIAKRDGSQLTAGDPVQDAVVEIVTVEVPGEVKPPTPGETKGAKAAEKATTVGITGPGRLELVDKTGGSGGGVVRWGRSLRQEKQKQAGKVLDLYKFEENAVFHDPQSGFNLKSQSIWLWTAPGEPAKAEAAPPGGKKPPASGALPERLVATGDVHVDSDEMVVRRTNKLTVWFRDVAPPKPVVSAPGAAGGAVAAKPKGDAPLPEVPPLTGAEPPKVAAADPRALNEPAKEVEKPNPIRLQAETIETWVVRFPQPADEVKPVGPPAEKAAAKPADKPKLKYQLETARCDDDVWVHQDPDPNDPNRPANGIDIKGHKLTLDHAPPSGSVLTVTGGRNKDNFAEVKFDGNTIFGGTVLIDQPNNTVSVDGRGKLTSLTGSDVAGNDLSAPTDLIVFWSKRMKFEGAKSFAQFVGTVTVQQKAAADPPGKPAAAVPAAERLPRPREAGSANTTVNTANVWCHQLDLTLDRPVYFNQLQRTDRNKRAAGKPDDRTAKGGPAADGERPKLKAVTALPSDEPGAEPHEKFVIYRETAEDAKGGIVRARMLTARQMDFANRAKEQELYAVGPGELRILQPEQANDSPPPSGDPSVRVSAKTPDKDKGEMKLTVVNFPQKMLGTDKGGGEYQEAKFDDGAVVMNAPGTDLTTRLEPHALPKGAIYLTCRDQMIVSSVRTKKDAAADQRLTALGNAEFRDDNRTGLGDKIVYDGTRVTLLGTDKRLAKLESTRKGVNSEQSTRAKKFVYNSRTGQVEVSESSGGSFGSGK